MTPLPAPPTKILYDNSANSELRCPRRAQLKLMLGLHTPADRNMLFGSAFHRAVESLSKWELPATDTAPARSFNSDIYMLDGTHNVLAIVQDACVEAAAHYNLQGLDEDKLALIVRKFYLEKQIPKPVLDLNGRPAVEIKFAYELGRDNPPIYLCGTIDNLTVEKLGNTYYLIITDYKSTSHKSPSHHLKGYMLDSQLPFYLWFLYHFRHTILPPELLSLPLAARIRGIYVDMSPVYFADSDVITMSPRVMQDMDEIINDSVALFKNIHNLTARNQLAPKLGIARGACKNCDFSHICIMHNEERERTAIAVAPKRVYDPAKFR